MLEVGQEVYYARIMKIHNVYDLLEIKIRTVNEDYFAGIYERTKQTFLFSKKDLGKTVFEKRYEALEYLRKEKDY